MGSKPDSHKQTSKRVRGDSKRAASKRDLASGGDHSATRDRMKPTCSVEAVRPLEDVLRRRIIGHEAAVHPLVCSFSRLLSGLRDPSRPLLTGLLLGPTGVGKTETANVPAQALFGSE